MARRRKNTRQDYFTEFAMLAILFGFLFGSWYTHSFLIAGVIAAVLFGIFYCVASALGNRSREQLKRSGITEIDKMDGRQFEHYLSLLFQNQGYKVKVTKETGDFGADLIIQKDGKKIIVQAKRQGKNVGISAVQQAQAAIAHYRAHEAWVVSNRDYTEPARTLASANSVRLINRDSLLQMIRAMNPTIIPNAEQVRKEIPRKKENCKVCGKPLIVRKGQHGEFLGCTGYPDCRNTKSLTV